MAVKVENFRMRTPILSRLAATATVTVIALSLAACSRSAEAGSPAPTLSHVDTPLEITTTPSRPVADLPPAATTKGWGKPSFEDDFNESQLDPADWSIYNSPDAATPRSPSAVTLGAGALDITGGINAQGQDISGGIGSQMNQMYGRWEVQFRVDKGAGYSAVALLWPQQDSDWPTAGEVDFAEINRGSRTIANMFVHNGPDNTQVSDTMHGDFTQWHTFAVEWLPGHVAFYLDGVRQSFVVTTKANPKMVPNVEPMHLALQLDQGCDNWIQCRNSLTPPTVIMQVAWVKIFAPPLLGAS
jgi:beta-glucanase (GH16 family)